jgi:nitrate reductase delta subunit
MNYASTYFKLVSILMQYPDDAYLQALPELETVAEQLNQGRERAGIEAFLADLKTHDALQLQERYTAAFDLNPSTTLNLTYHQWGDSEKRAAALTRLQQLYLDAGYEKSSGELPDYLPLVLEFMASVSEAQRSEPIRKCLTSLETIVDRLRPIALPYAELLTPLAATFKDQPQVQTAQGID